MLQATCRTSPRLLVVLIAVLLSTALAEFVGQCSDNPVNETDSLWDEITSNGVCELYNGLTTYCNPVFEEDVDYVYIPYKRTYGSQDSLSQELNFANFLIQTLPDKCREIARQLICTYYFIPCGRNGTMYPPVAICKEECEYLSVDLCPEEWQLGLSYLANEPEFFESIGLYLVNCSNPGRILEPLPHCCTNLGLIPDDPASNITTNSTLSKRTVIIAAAAGGGGLLIVAVVVALLIIVCFCHREKHRSISESCEIKQSATTRVYVPQKLMVEDNKEFHQSVNTSDVMLRLGVLGHSGQAIPRVPSGYLRQMSDGKMLILHEQLQLMDPLGKGEFGVVYRARWNGFHGESPQVVAVKTLKALFNQSDIEHLMEESMVMKNFDHPNVLNLIGVCVVPVPLLVLPFMAKGSLLNYLKTERPNLATAEGADSDVIEETQRKLLSMCLQIARGMEYLAEQKFVHRDLAARNCMIDDHSQIKVADFGLSEDIYMRNYFRQGKQDNAVKLPIKWMALESLQDRVFSEKTDVWSFGVTCWEVFSMGKAPYPGVDPFSLVKFLEEGNRLDKPSDAACSDEIYNFLMLYCWSLNVEKRPKFSQLVKQISIILEAIAGYIDFDNIQEVITVVEMDPIMDTHQEGVDSGLDQAEEEAD